MRNVRIVKDYLPHNKTNFCLHLIISEIGKGYSFKNGKSLEGDDCFKVGLNLINRRYFHIITIL